MKRDLTLRAPIAASFAIAAILILFWPTFASMVAIWNRDDTFTHGYLIPLLCGWLLWRDRDALATVPITPEYRGLWLVAALLIGWLAADLVEVQVIRQAAATALIPVSLWIVLGTPWTKRALFPLLYLFFAVPFGDFLVPYLVRFTTEFTVAAVQLVGVPIFRDGDAFSLPSGNFEVVKACSGVRYLIATIALGTLFAHLSYSSWKKRLWFMALCLVLPIVANGIRAFGIVMIANYTDMKYAVGVDHLIYGWIFFGVVMLLLFWLGGKFADAPEEIRHANPSPVNRVSWAPFAAFVALIALAPLSSFAIQSELSHHDATPIALIESEGEWVGPSAIDTEWKPVFARTDTTIAGRFRSSTGDVNVFARRYSSQAEGAEEATAARLISESELGWRLDAFERKTLDRHVVDAADVISRTGVHWRTWRWYLIDNAEARGATHAKWLQLLSWLKGRAPEATVVCVAVSMKDPRTESPVLADGILKSFVDARSWSLIREKLR